MLAKRWVSALILVFGYGAFCLAQSPQVNNTYFGDEHQPGKLLHMNIAKLIDSGQSLPSAIINSINAITMVENTTLSDESKAVLVYDLLLAKKFYKEMFASNSLIDATKMLIEQNREKTAQIIALGISLYPDFSREVVDGAALSSTMSLENILIVALQAGANLDSISLSNVRHKPIPPPLSAIPLGVGIGAGGNGGGDESATSN